MPNQAAKIMSILPNRSESGRQQKTAKLAYEFWLARGFRGGSPAEDWLRAHREVGGEVGTPTLRRTKVGTYLVERTLD